MCEEKTGQEIEVYQTNRYLKKFKSLTPPAQEGVDDEVEKVIDDPEIGERKKGDLSHLWVHKFYIEKQEYLLGYSWIEEKLEIYLLQLGTHENYYSEQKRHRKADLKLIS